MTDLQIISEVIARAPDWLRRDLLSDDRNARAAAEEALAVTIANALAKADQK
jgi:hypothetical protein